MSIIWTLRKYADSIQQRQEEADHKSAREAPLTERATGSVEQAAPPAEPPRVMHQCRVCQFRSDRHSYGPHCLAETMEPLEA